MATQILLFSRFDLLKENQRLVLVGRYLLGMSLRELGERMQLSCERIRQIENAALKRIARGRSNTGSGDASVCNANSTQDDVPRSRG